MSKRPQSESCTRAAEYQYCTHCNVRVRGHEWTQHVRSKRHMSFLFFGHAGEQVRHIAIDKPGGGMRYLRPADVPHRVVNVARSARTLALSGLFPHSGQVLFERACAHFAPEQLCESMLQEEADPERECDAEAIICLAAKLAAGQSSCPHLDVLVALPIDQVEEIALSCALEALAGATPDCAISYCYYYRQYSFYYYYYYYYYSCHYYHHYY